MPLQNVEWRISWFGIRFIIVIMSARKAADPPPLPTALDAPAPSYK